ncbi:MAG: regulatory protein GemA [Pseudomonadota bacterium]|nr:regulatory protein GemA [Pseudomonadota bacterium]
MRSTNVVAKPAVFDRAAQHRRSMIAKINIARQQLDMNEDDYRQGLFDTTGLTSLRDCSDGQLERMLGWLKGKGFKALPGKKAASHPMALKARALWISLFHLGAVHNRSDFALEAFAKRQLGCERLDWARQSDGYRLIEALKQMAVRHGWVQHDRATQKPLDPIGLQRSLCNAILAKLKAGNHVPDDWGLHDAGWKLCSIENARERAWTAEDYARLASNLGTKLRELGGSSNGEN